jgi:hypothetical protein
MGHVRLGNPDVWESIGVIDSGVSKHTHSNVWGIP